MDLYDDSRTLIYSGPLARKSRSDNWHSWSELLVALLDNYRECFPTPHSTRRIYTTHCAFRTQFYSCGKKPARTGPSSGSSSPE